MTENLTREAEHWPTYSALDVWARRLGALVVAGVAAYASYQHQLGFALAGGADLTTARVWPLSVDGLLVLSTTGLLREGRRTSVRARYALRVAFAVGIIVSLAANIATAPSMAWAPILVAGWPPVALLLAVELLGHRRTREAGVQDSADNPVRDPKPGTETQNETASRIETSAMPEKVITLAETRLSRRTAEQVMWDHYQRALAAGRPAPSGAELDKVAQTNNYGRAVLRKWQRKGRTQSRTASSAS